MSNPSVILNAVNNITIEDRPVPTLPDSHYVKVRVTHTGICGLDVHYYTHGSIGVYELKAPMVLGHESAGEVVEVGSDVTLLAVGDRVAIEPGIPSRYSSEFRAGCYNLDPAVRFAATPPIDGTLARYYCVPADFAYKLPAHVSNECGALVEPLAVAVHLNKLAGTVFGDSVAVYGAGPVGLLIAATARAFGATQVLVVDVVDAKLELAKQMGATHVFNSKNGGAPEVAAPRIVFEASGAEVCIRAGLALVGRGGVFVQVGMGKDDVNFPMSEVLGKELTVKGVFRYAHGDYTTAVELVASGKVEVERLVSHRFKFDDAVEAYETVRRGEAVKAIIEGPQ